MQAHKKTLMAVKEFLESQEGWDLSELKEQLIEDTNLLRHEAAEPFALSVDECGIEWSGEDICILSDFLDVYTDKFIERMCNILDSFVGEELFLSDEQ